MRAAQKLNHPSLFYHLSAEMSKRLPFMYRNVADHLAATNHLTLEELGALDRLLDNYWFCGESLEFSDEKIAKF